jgi:hypothetical protein
MEKQHYMKKFLLLFAIVSISASTLLARTGDEKQAVMAVIERLFYEMGSANPEGIEALGTPENQLVAIQKLPNGTSRISTITNQQFAKMFSDKSRKLQEEMFDPQIEVNGDYAMVYGRYIFWVDGKISHCGVNQFNLVKIGDEWKIANGASTMEPAGCTEKEKAMKPDPRKW